MSNEAEKNRLDEAQAGRAAWKKWGPYLSERQWGTVREDYSDNGDAWNYFSHDQARSRAYRWGEDGLAGISDDHQVLCFALALWNGSDPILKERAFGLANGEGNHGEDVKEYYFYLDSTPTHSYMKYLYKYPQAAYPYTDLVETNRSRGKHEAEYELLDTGVFDDNRYFDVFVEYAKAAPEDVLVRISVFNRSPDAAPLHLLPTLWFRNTWSQPGGGSKPFLERVDFSGQAAVRARHSDPLFLESLGEYYLYCDSDVPLLFTENETNNTRLFGTGNASPYAKDGIHDFIVHGDAAAVNPAQQGTKAAPHYQLNIGGGESQVARLRLTTQAPGAASAPFHDFDAVFAARLEDADAFYASMTPLAIRDNPDRVSVMRQALAGMLWTKQYFYYDLGVWLDEHGAGGRLPKPERRRVRNSEWAHMFNDDIISMPDKWEYPWYAAWDLAFHMIPLSMVDPDFAKQQLDLMLRNDYLHPNGQLPAYEWNFGDVNPPVHAWATMQLYVLDKERHGGRGDIEFLKYAFSKLLVNFTWWVNRKDRTGANVFEGGFLGLDNIGVFDRSSPLPTGGYLDQADGTAWMVFFSQQMLRIAVELALQEPLYEEFVEKFFQHTVFIAGALDSVGERNDEMWDEEDGFFYDVLRFPDGSATRLKVRSIVGLLPLAAVAVFEEDLLTRLPKFRERARLFLGRHPELAANMHLPQQPGVANRRMLAIVGEHKLRRILARMLDEEEFFSPHGIRALSRFHLEHPYVFHHAGQEYRVAYVPGDSDTGMFGGNSNWRGPVWMPINYLLYTSLIRLYAYFGEDFKVECPTGSGRMMTLLEVAQELGERLSRIFLRDSDGRRPVYGAANKYRDDPHWRDLVLFYEYFHGDTGAGIGASHQTGWTGCVARIIQGNAMLSKDLLLTPGAQVATLRALRAAHRGPESTTHGIPVNPEKAT
ncbi:Acyl-coenzyme A synthetases/AMP-(fatty) acid ligase (plasmid) [Cupriavidus necator H850]|uniref:MGH1-like glycoside hydrolase domain-containing protein n=1 Tax=Cupriavidus necator TaxID=106590 RepID=UPI001E5ABB4C|nr:glucosidase [Cupriavidus necator]KAI3603149.1 Acyl-coenzyme A synthetases/AMP-(fatty) acid ligase [Cupriavidus necator H850]